MNSKSTPYLMNCIEVILIIIVTIFTIGGPIYCGELLPLPPEGLQQQQKSVDPGVYIEFRQRIQPLNCSDLKQLKEKLINSCASPQSQKYVDYYMNLQKIVDETIMSKKCP
jgi:hypothetical protein